MKPSLKTAMTPFPYSVERTAPLSEARAVMDRHEVRHLPVTDGHELVGVITDRDLWSLPSPRARAEGAGELTVGDAYVSDAYVVDLNEPLDRVLLTMAERHIGSALVTRKGRLAGVFTAVDACRCFGEYLQHTFPAPGGDEAA
jgi:acetoin utilization protein AcuB